MTTAFSARAWTHVADRYADVCRHPFVTGLAGGTLPDAVFAHYLADDAHYLVGYARTLARIASRLPDVDDVGAWAGFAAGAVEAERSLHVGELARRGVEPATHVPTSACRDYVDALARQDRRRAWAGGLGSLVVLVSCAACVLATALLTADAGLTGPLVGVLLLAPVGLVDVLDAVAEAERLRPRVQAARRRLVALEGGSDPMPAPLDGTRRPDGFALDLQDVTLGWDADLVEHLTVHVPEGARVVVTGPSGSGKSTLAATLSRLVAARSGTVRLGGVDLLDLDREQVRAVVGWMQQDTVLFDTTVRENLRVADPRADDATLWRALGRVRLADTVASWPDGLDTVLGEDGSRVSGGERQRLGLARMLLAGHRVLVLDEPTEHLDGETARALLDDVDALAPEHTVVVVSHAPEVVARYPQRVDLRPSPVRRPRVVR